MSQYILRIDKVNCEKKKKINFSNALPGPLLQFFTSHALKSLTTRRLQLKRIFWGKFECI